MAAGKGFITRRSLNSREVYVTRIYEDSDDEVNIELSPRRQPRSASSENGIEFQDDHTDSVYDHGDNKLFDGRDLAISRSIHSAAPFEKKAKRKERADSKESDHVDMPVKSSKDVAMGFKRRLSEQRNIVDHFSTFDIFIGVGCIILFIVDITTDIKLAVDYFLETEWFYGSVTTCLIVFPSLVTCCLGLHWYIIDYRTEQDVIRRSKERKGHVRATPKGLWFCRFFFTLLQFGPVVRTVEYLHYGCKSRSKRCSEKEKRRYHWWMLYEDVDNCLLRLFESFLESAPQLAFQLYVLITTKPNENVILTTTRSLALLSSWGSLAISLVSYQKSLRNSRDDKEKMEIISLPFYFLWRAVETGGRVLCLAMFASAFDFWVFGIILFHWVVISGWLMNQRTTFYNNRCLEKAFNIICGYVMLFCFINLREGNTRYRFLIFYIIFYIENFFMLTFWFRFTPDLGEWFHLWGFITVLIFFVLHIVFQLLFYKFFHPSKNIRWCLDCDSYTFYDSVCYDVRPEKDDAVGSPNKRYTSQQMLALADTQEVIVAPSRDADKLNLSVRAATVTVHGMGDCMQKGAAEIPRAKAQVQQKPRPTTHQERVDVHVSRAASAEKVTAAGNSK